MNKLKKMAAFLFAVLCMVLLPFTQARAENEVMIVYAHVPEGWENPCVWAWADDGTGAFDAWPGEQMKQDEDNEGWYYLYVPTAAGANVIINANEGTVQTADYKTGSKNVWLTITDADTVEVSNDPQTVGELPAYEKLVTVNVQAPDDWEFPSLWAWSAPDGTNVFANWPGQELTAGTDGWYSYEIPAWVNSIIVNGNLGTVQTTDISVEPGKDIWLVVTDADNYELFYEKPQVETPQEDLITVHAKAPADWQFPSLWAWSAPDGTNVFANWPGQELTAGEDGWLSYDIPNWVNSIIINGNLGGVQTSDISIETGKDVWVVVTDAENYEVYYEEPEIVEESTEPEVTAEPAAAQETVTEPEKKGNSALVVGAGVAVLAACGIGGGVVYSRKKKG